MRMNWTQPVRGEPEDAVWVDSCKPELRGIDDSCWLVARASSSDHTFSRISAINSLTDNDDTD